MRLMRAAIWGALSSLVVLAGCATMDREEVRDSDLVPYTIVDGAIPTPLTEKPGDAAAGRKVAVSKKLGNCLACHGLPIPEEQFHGDIGPDLRGVAGRLSVGEMRLRLVDAKRINPHTSMPSFYRKDGLIDIYKPFIGKTILSAQQVEDVIAYLQTLKY